MGPKFSIEIKSCTLKGVKKMTRRHVWRIKDKYFYQHCNGDKDLEIRVGYDSIKKASRGDIIIFMNHEDTEFEITRLAIYPNFEAMLKKENHQRILPGASSQQTLKTLKKIYPLPKEVLGVYVFELKRVEAQSKTPEFFRVSELLQEGKRQEFSQVVAECYSITDWISKDYPDHCAHFYNKYVPGIFRGEREIIAGRLDGKIVAVAFLKKALEPTALGPNGHSELERKLSTLFVDPQYRNIGIASELLRRSFNWLGTTTPLATIAGYKLDQFVHIIEKYGWKETQILPRYYSQDSAEHVYNGQI